MPCPSQQYYYDYVFLSLNKVMYTVYLANLNKKKINRLQTNRVIYLHVVVKGATRVFAFWGKTRECERRGIPASTTHSPKLCWRGKRWPNNVPALGESLLFAGLALTTNTLNVQSCFIIVGPASTTIS